MYSEEGVCSLACVGWFRKGASMLSLAIVRDVIVLPHCGIKSQPLYFLPPQSPNTDIW